MSGGHWEKKTDRWQGEKRGTSDIKGSLFYSLVSDAETGVMQPQTKEYLRLLETRRSKRILL